MKTYVAVTDNDWYRALRSRPDLEEVNFWQPSSGRHFRALQPGEPFLFKLHSPENFIVGGGWYLRQILDLPSSLVWEAFEEKNGATSLAEMRQRIEKYRKVAANRLEDYRIGCILLHQPFFFDESEWIQVPADFSKHTQQGKTYDTSTPQGRSLWAEVKLRLQAAQPGAVAEPQVQMFGDPVLVRPRMGQSAFRLLITETYERRCAVTREKALPALEAAHIRPVHEGGLHLLENGLLLRSDVHRLFDKGYVTVTPAYRFRVSSRLKAEFDNGEPYYPLDRQEIWLPPEEHERPSAEFLEWHSDSVFRG
jgi:putative restriction endonuclease